MDDLGTNSPAPLDPRFTPEPSARPRHQLSQLSPPSPASSVGPRYQLSQLSLSSPARPAGPRRRLSHLPPLSPAFRQIIEDRFAGWGTIDEQRDFYDERDCLDPSHHLASEKLKDRAEDDVVIFDYSLDPDYLKSTEKYPPAEEGAPSSGPFGVDDDIFFRVPKNKLIGSKQFDQIINPSNEPRLTVSRGPRLNVIDFPQCYDAHDGSLLNSMGKKLGLQREGETGFMDAHSERVRALPGNERFRTGISFRIPSKKPGNLPTSSSSEDRFILFVSFPYFGKSGGDFALGHESESVGLLDFKRLEVDIPKDGAPSSGGLGKERIATFRSEVDPERKAVVSAEERDIGEILVHQARYMIFDNYTMATFRSKEDSVKGQVPLHRFQQRIGAFRAMVHMIANRMNLELWILGKLRAFLSKLEEDIDRMILKEGTYEYDQKVEKISGGRSLRRILKEGTYEDDEKVEKISRGRLLRRIFQSQVIATEGDRQRWREEEERERKVKVRERKQERVRDLLTSINNLGAALLAVIRVSERQIAVLQDLHTVFSTSYRTKTQENEKGYSSPRNPFYRNIVPIPVLLENPGQIWPGAVDTVDEVIRERRSFVLEVKELVGNMEIRRKILFGFLKSDQAKSTLSARIAQEAASMKRTEAFRVQQVQQAQTLSVFTVVATAFLPLSFCTSYFGMNNIKEFNENPLSRLEFWRVTGPVCAGITLLALVIISWERLRLAYARDSPVSSHEKREGDIESGILNSGPREIQPSLSQRDTRADPQSI